MYDDYMELGSRLVESQKFDVGRVLNFDKCAYCKLDCEGGGFFKCRNYALQFERNKTTIIQWVKYYINKGYVITWNDDDVSNFFRCVVPEFVDGLMWDMDKGGVNIEFFSTSQSIKKIAKVSLITGKQSYINYNFTTSEQVDFIKNFSNLLTGAITLMGGA